MKIHIVQKGDTLWEIAKKYGVQFEDLKSINSQLSNPDMIMPGMKIKVPGTGNTKQAQMMQSNTKINMGSKKEAPIPGATVSPVKEMPMQEMVSPVPIQQEPTVMKEQPIMSKEQSMPMPQPAQTMPAMPQPIIPDVDINNYYMVNMANMMAQKPQQVQQPQSKPEPQPQQPQPQPIVVEVESAETPAQVQPYPVMVDACVPITPVMPGTGFCPPLYHQNTYMPMYGPGPVQIQPLQQFHTEESSSMCEPHMPSWHYGEYMPVMHQQQMMPMHGGMQYNQGFVHPQAPFVSPHGLHHHDESTSHYASESSSHMIQATYVQPVIEMQAPYQQTENVPMMEEELEEDCGCGAPEIPTSMDEETNMQPQYYQPQMQSWDQLQKNEGQSSVNDPQMSGSQASMYQPQMSKSQSGMYHPQMSGSQASMYPQMSGSQANMYQPQMSGSQASMYQPQMSGTQSSMYQPQMSGSQADMSQAQMSGSQASMYQPQMSGSQASMYQPQMGGNQPGMLQPQMIGQSGQYTMPMQPWQQGMLQTQMNPNQSFTPQMRVNHSVSPMGDVPFYGQDENMSDIGKLTSYSDAFDLPRFADESNE